MSELPQGVDVSYSFLKVKIKQCTSDATLCWYRKHIGEIFVTRKKTWYKDGKPDGESYEVLKTPEGGFNGYLSEDDIEIVG